MGNRLVELQTDFFINLVTGTFVKDQPGWLVVPYDLKRSPRAFEFGLIYCAAMHNHHSATLDGKKSP